MRTLRHALRSLLRSPGYVAVVVATLAVAVGANAAIFALIREALLRPLPFRQPGRLVRFWDAGQQGERFSVSPPVWAALRARTDLFEATGASTDTMFNLTGQGEPDTLIGYRLSAGFPQMLGVRPLLGRVFTAEEDRPGHERVVVLMHSLWQRRFGGDPGVVGRAVSLSGNTYTVIGVMPAGFTYPIGTELWAPLALPEGARDDGSLRFLRVVARLRPGVELGRVRQAVTEIAGRLRRERPDSWRGRALLVHSFDEEHNQGARAPLLALGGAVVFVLVGACANLAGLALARSVGRRRDLAVRIALGAGRGQLLRESYAEWALLAAAGALLGVMLAGWLAQLLPGLFPATIANLPLPKLGTVPVDGTVALFAALAAAAVAFAAGAVPAAHALAVEAGDTLKAAGRTLAGGRGGLLRALVAAEVGLALVLLVGAGLLARAFQHLQQGGLGFDAEHVLTARLILPDYRYSEPRRILALHDGLLERVRALPGVEAAGAVAMLPLSGWEAGTTFQLDGQPPAERGKEPEADLQWIDGGYLAATRVPLLAGRAFDERDRPTAPDVALVNATFVRRFLGGAVPAAVGRRLVFADRAAGREQARPREIVGVVGDVRHLGFEEPPPPTVYVPFTQDPVPVLCLTVRTSADPASLAPALRQAVWSQDPEQPVSYLMPYDQLAAESLTLRRLSALLASAFAAVAVGLAALGAYGVVAQAVGSGRREIGVRLALGARPAAVVATVLRQALGASALGAVAGMLAAVVVGRLLRGLLFGVAPLDPVALAGAASTLLVTAGLAAWLPARRAGRLDPAVVLRDE